MPLPLQVQNPIAACATLTSKSTSATFTSKSTFAAFTTLTCASH
jgi:hypothetical protein